MTSLFEKSALATLPLQNRCVMSPLTRCRALGNVPNDLMVEYYTQRTCVVLIVSEGTHRRRPMASVMRVFPAFIPPHTWQAGAR